MSPKLISADSKSMHAPTCLEARVHTHRQTVRTHMSAFTTHIGTHARLHWCACRSGKRFTNHGQLCCCKHEHGTDECTRVGAQHRVVLFVDQPGYCRTTKCSFPPGTVTKSTQFLSGSCVKRCKIHASDVSRFLVQIWLQGSGTP